MVFNYNLSHQPRATKFWSVILRCPKWKVSRNLCKNNWTTSAPSRLTISSHKAKKHFELPFWVELFLPPDSIIYAQARWLQLKNRPQTPRESPPAKVVISCKRPSVFGHVSILGCRTKIKVHFSKLSRPGPGSTRTPSTFTFRGNKTLKLICTKICVLRLAAEVIIEHHYWDARIYKFGWFYRRPSKK